MNSVVLSLGSNVGNRSANLDEAIHLLEALPCRVVKKSSVYETAPWGNTDQPSFYNQAIEVETGIEALILMQHILSIEKNMGRARQQKWEPRIIDIDILFFNDERIDSAELKVPHRHLHERKFALEPLSEIVPERIHPVFHMTVSQLLAALDDGSSVEKLKFTSHE